MCLSRGGWPVGAAGVHSQPGLSFQALPMSVKGQCGGQVVPLSSLRDKRDTGEGLALPPPTPAGGSRSLVAPQHLGCLPCRPRPRGPDPVCGRREEGAEGGREASGILLVCTWITGEICEQGWMLVEWAIHIQIYILNLTCSSVGQELAEPLDTGPDLLCNRLALEGS